MKTETELILLEVKKIKYKKKLNLKKNRAIDNRVIKKSCTFFAL